MSYPVSGMVRDFKPEGMITDHAIIPHGMSVVLTAPSVFRFTAAACPDRHLHAAQLMGAPIADASPERAGHILADQIVSLMKQLEVPNGLFCHWLCRKRYSRARRGHASPTPRDQTLSAARRRRGLGAPVQRCDGCVVRRDRAIPIAVFCVTPYDGSAGDSAAHVVGPPLNRDYLHFALSTASNCIYLEDLSWTRN